MVGKYDIEVYNARVHYFLTIKRNITIIKGDSATGKSELIRLIADHEMNGASSGITVKCDRPCTVLTPVDWEQRLITLYGYIVFIDETAGFLKSKRFAELVRGADSYFVIVTRDDLSELPYSVDEIYGLRNVTGTSDYKTYKRVYNETYKLYNLSFDHEVRPEHVITEDSNSGYQFFEKVYPGICEPAGGKSKIYDIIKEKDHALVIVDGAAFGCEMEKVMRYLSVSRKDCVIYAPESFEYLLLRSGIVQVPLDVLDRTYDYADSKDYLSWEEFYTAYLIQATQGGIYQYMKSKLRETYKTEGSVRRVVQIMPEEIKPDI